LKGAESVSGDVPQKGLNTKRGEQRGGGGGAAGKKTQKAECGGKKKKKNFPRGGTSEDEGFVGEKKMGSPRSKGGDVNKWKKGGKKNARNGGKSVRGKKSTNRG